MLAKAFEIEVKNNKNVPINLSLEERVPISQDKEIKVEEIETGNAIYDDKKGSVKWRLHLAPKASDKKKFSYKVRYPRDKTINL